MADVCRDDENCVVVRTPQGTAIGVNRESHFLHVKAEEPIEVFVPSDSMKQFFTGDGQLLWRSFNELSCQEEDLVRL